MAIALGAYDGELRQTIVRMKQSIEQSLTFRIGQLLGDRAAAMLADDRLDILCPVPMHWLRRILRRTSSAETLARSAAGRLKIPVHPRLVLCTRQTQKQSLLPQDKRRANVAGAFRVERRRHVRGLHVGVVDDLMTTGATLDEIARALKGSGARRVTALVAARAARTDFRIRRGQKIKAERDEDGHKA